MTLCMDHKQARVSRKRKGLDKRGKKGGHRSIWSSLQINGKEREIERVWYEKEKRIALLLSFLCLVTAMLSDHLVSLSGISMAQPDPLFFINFDIENADQVYETFMVIKLFYDLLANCNQEMVRFFCLQRYRVKINWVRFLLSNMEMLWLIKWCS